MDPFYLDTTTGRRYPLDMRRWRSDDAHPLDVCPLPGISRTQIDRSIRSLWRYAAALPIAITNPISLGEGCTPLVDAELGNAKALFKLEWFAPTGSFKDRGASVMLSMLRQWGVREVLEDSSGNGGSAIAAYAAAGGMQAHILAPAATAPNKIAQIRAYGAQLTLVQGTRDEVGEAALQMSKDIYYASHSWHPMFLAGVKTLAYELWEDLGFRAPDNIVIPTGGGSNVLGCDIGFGELLRRREIDRLPRLFAVQPENCAPLFLAQDTGYPSRDFQSKPTLAEGAAVSRPVRARAVLGAVKGSGGRVIAASEEAIADAVRALAARGLYVEPTAALAAAGFVQLVETGVIKPEERTVVLLTGTGLKAAEKIGALFDRAPPLDRESRNSCAAPEIESRTA
jgi:threonine synthase